MKLTLNSLVFDAQPKPRNTSFIAVQKGHTVVERTRKILDRDSL